MAFPEARIWRRKIRGVLILAAKGTPATKRLLSPSSSTDENHENHPAEVEVEEEGSTRFYANQRSFKEEDEEVKEFISPLSKADWVITIKEKLDQVPLCRGSNSWLNHCIFRVPRNLREIEPKAYIPQIVSIGPYHRGKSCLKDMERHKWRLLRHLLERTGHTLELYLEAMAELEEQARQSYSIQSIDIPSREFIEMMLLDACFILELLRVSVKGFIYCGYSWGDPIFSSRGALPTIQRDLLMLENQLPLFVLDRLFALSCEPEETESVSQLALQFFDSVIHGCKDATLNTDEPGLHFLHVIRQSLIPASLSTLGCGVPIKHDDHQPQLMMYCVTWLRGSGLKFQKKNTSNFTDIEFEDGILYIPRLVIHDSTKSIFLNLMAFEQCYPHCSNHVTSYISFMDGLINSPNDVAYLRHRRIIDHGLGSEEEVAILFNNLCKEISFNINDCYLSKVSSDVNRYFDKRWNRWRASLKQEYFSNPWAIVSLLAAICLIGLTLTQTFYTIFPYYFPL